MQPKAGVNLLGRSATYGLVIGVVMGMLIAGLALPLAFGSRTPEAFTTKAGPTTTTLPNGSLGAPLAGGETTVREGSGVADLGGGSVGRSAGAAAVQRTLPPDATLTASDRGVTAKTIKVGVLIGDASDASSVGLVIPSDTDAERKGWQAFIDMTNDRGGIVGRKIVPVYKVFSAFDDEAAQAACLEFAKDDKVFAVLNSSWMYGERPLCYTQHNQTPLLSRWIGATDRIYDSSRGYLSGSFPSYNRVARNMAIEAFKGGLLKGKRVGVLAGASEFGRSVGDDLIAQLKALKVTITHVSFLPADNAQAQIPGEVQQMKRKDVQVVLLSTLWIDHTAFVQTAEAQLFYPQYVASDIDEASDDIATQGMPRSYEGAIAYTFKRGGEFRTNLPESPVDKACADRYEKKTGERIPRNERGPELDACDIVGRFESAALLAGPKLTRDRFSGAMASLGDVDIPFTAGGSFRGAKLDGSDFLRTKRFKFSCTCYEIISGFRRGHD